MFKRIKQFFNQREEIEYLKQRIERLEADAGNPEKVVAKIIGRDLKIVNVYGFSDNQKKEYYHNAQQALNNETLQNEIRTIINDNIDFLAIEAKSYNKVRDCRMVILAFKLLQDRLKNVEVID